MFSHQPDKKSLTKSDTSDYKKEALWLLFCFFFIVVNFKEKYSAYHRNNDSDNGHGDKHADKVALFVYTADNYRDDAADGD